MVGGQIVDAFAVSGAPGGDKDEPCAIAGLAKIQDRLNYADRRFRRCADRDDFRRRRLIADGYLSGAHGTGTA
jgi:hypothetical protein